MLTEKKLDKFYKEEVKRRRELAQLNVDKSEDILQMVSWIGCSISERHWNSIVQEDKVPKYLVLIMDPKGQADCLLNWKAYDEEAMMAKIKKMTLNNEKYLEELLRKYYDVDKKTEDEWHLTLK